MVVVMGAMIAVAVAVSVEGGMAFACLVDRLIG